MSVRDEFLKEIEKQRKKSKAKKKFSGNFMDYVEMVQKNPEIVKASHKRLYDSIMNHGMEKMPDSNPRKQKVFDNDEIRVYGYFKEQFFGMERVLEKLMSFLKSAAFKGEESKQASGVYFGSRSQFLSTNGPPRRGGKIYGQKGEEAQAKERRAGSRSVIIRPSSLCATSPVDIIILDVVSWTTSVILGRGTD